MNLDETDRALLGISLSALLFLVILLASLPAVTKADTVAECSLATLTDEATGIQGHYVAYMREDGRRAIYRHLPHQRAYQIFAGNGPQMQLDYLCLPPLPEIDLQGDDDE